MKINVFESFYINIKIHVNINLNFIDNVIYYIKKLTSRLCFFVNVKKETFYLIYDNNLHAD